MNLQVAAFEAAYGTFAQLPPSDMPEIAFSGRSNVGKSSLLNRLFNRKSLARVSSVPGKTVTINFYRVGDVRFVDLPGYGYAKVPKAEKQRWAEMMEGYFNSEREIKLVVQLIDMRHSPTKDDLQMLAFLRENGIPFAVALTKCDKLNKTEYNNRFTSVQTELDFVPASRLIPVSAVTGTGREELLSVMQSYLD